MDSNQSPRIDAKYVGEKQNFVALYSQGKMIGKPILWTHYGTMFKGRTEEDRDAFHASLASLTKEEWDGLCLASILNWRDHGVA